MWRLIFVVMKCIEIWRNPLGRLISTGWKSWKIYMRYRPEIRLVPTRHIYIPRITLHLDMLAISWFEKYHSLLYGYKMVCSRPVIGYLDVLKVLIIARWTHRQILSNLFPSFIQQNVIFLWIVKSWKWGQLHKARLLMMCSYLNGQSMRRIFCWRWELRSSRIMCRRP